MRLFNRSFAAALALASLQVSGCGSDYRSDRSSVEQPKADGLAIRDGAIVSLRDHAAVGQLVNPRGGSCTGTLIGPKHVLTARHCVTVDGTVQGEPIPGYFQYNFYVGGDLGRPYANSYASAKVHVVPNRPDLDVAIVELSSKVSRVDLGGGSYALIDYPRIAPSHTFGSLSSYAVVGTGTWVQTQGTGTGLGEKRIGSLAYSRMERINGDVFDHAFLKASSPIDDDFIGPVEYVPSQVGCAGDSGAAIYGTSSQIVAVLDRAAGYFSPDMYAEQACAATIGNYVIPASEFASWAETIAPPTVLLPSATNVDGGTKISVNYENLKAEAGKRAWLAIAKSGDAAGAFYKDPSGAIQHWAYAPNATDGVTLTAPLAPGAYEIRAYDSDSAPYTVVRRMSISVKAPTESFAADKSVYGIGAPIKVNYAAIPASQFWVSLAAVGSAATSFEAWSYANGPTGQVVLAAPKSAGAYEIRAYKNATSYEVIKRLSIKVEVLPLVASLDKASYQAGESIKIAYENVATPRFWTAIAPAGAADTVYGNWGYATGSSGALELKAPLTGGTYEVRLFRDDVSFQVVKRLSISVQQMALALTATKSVYGVGEAISVSYAGIVAPRFWMSVTPVGASDTSYGTWTYANGPEGTATIPAPATAGAYEIRLYRSDASYEVIKRAAILVEQAGVSLTTMNASVAPGAMIGLEFSGSSAAKTWIGIAKAGERDAAWTSYAWVTGASGTASLKAPDLAGKYEVRLYQDAASYVVIKRAMIEVSP